VRWGEVELRGNTAWSIGQSRAADFLLGRRVCFEQRFTFDGDAMVNVPHSTLTIKKKPQKTAWVCSASGSV
jgi:hypothetical protein